MTPAQSGRHDQLRAAARRSTSGTQIFFTDRTWNGTTFGAAGGGEGTFTYTAGADLAAGTVVTITTAQLAAAGINLADTGETIYAYQGAINTPTTFLYAADIADGNTTFNGSLANTGLTSPAAPPAAIGGDNASYGDRGHNIQPTTLLQAISSADQLDHERQQPSQVPIDRQFLLARPTSRSGSPWPATPACSGCRATAPTPARSRYIALPEQSDSPATQLQPPERDRLRYGPRPVLRRRFRHRQPPHPAGQHRRSVQSGRRCRR